ncbi:alpha/beta fold hydrolase [Saccharopolyspora flava]|uniref:Pimeloyl-ACP methyl ester carboxylesterase n=1 Tax=Saccharopolyspora flava TaxID=95161 RepID=A0A1I6SZZ2_9PSEU|nr:alpha/beta fold hydrolase [Saccharopolyspora flava]SFS82408.1 Pimeloyl-ACP methyl ester carboxylesterase [Saccharopolyspora flava]
MREGFARAADGTRLAYQVNGDGPPLVLLAGQANNHRWWDGVREDFEGTHRTITLDHRGTGASDKPDIACTTRDFASDVIAVLDELGIASADVYGTSMGGRIAQWLAVDHPGRLRRLVLGCTSPGGPHAAERDADVRRALAQPDPVAAQRALLELMYSPEWLAEHDGPRCVLGDPDMPPHARRHHLAASNRHDAWEQLPRISARTLVLHGADDRMTPASNAELIAERIPGAEARVLPGLRHAYFHEGRPQTSDLVADFLRAR